MLLDSQLIWRLPCPIEPLFYYPDQLIYVAKRWFGIGLRVISFSTLSKLILKCIRKYLCRYTDLMPAVNDLPSLFTTKIS